MTTPATNASGKIKLWDRLEILVGEGPDPGRYLTRLEDFGQGVLVVGVPEFVGGNHLLSNGCPCKVVFAREDAVYRFDSQIAMVDRKGRRTYLLRAPEGIQRVQRRQFVRIDLRRPLTIIRLGGPQDPPPASLIAHATVSINISGGGMLIEAPIDLRPADLLLASVDFFPTIGLPPTVGAVVRRVDRPSAGPIAGIEFILERHIKAFFRPELLTLVPESARLLGRVMQNKLVNYVFQEQIKLRQKGLL